MTTRSCYTQGLLENMTPSGRFEDRRLGELTAEQAVAMVRFLPVPVHDMEAKSFCPPTFGMDGYGTDGLPADLHVPARNVCRLEDGSWVTWTPTGGSKFVSEADAEQFVREAFE